MNIQNSNKARLFTLIIGAVGLAISNQAQAACEYYRSVECPKTYRCYGEQYDLVDKDVFYNQRWSCGSGYAEPTYARARDCKYIHVSQNNYRASHCGPFQMEPKNKLGKPEVCDALPCIGDGIRLNIPESSGFFKY
jgi:hypothetical protein